MTLAGILRQDASACPAGVDVSVLASAIEHGVAPLVYRALQDRGDWGGIDSDVRAQLSKIAREAMLIEHVRAEHLASAVRSLDACGVRPLLFKGAALAASHYPEPWLRTRGDSDLLVRPAEAEAAGMVLGRLGFSRLPRPRGALVTQQSRYQGRVDGVPLAYDVHWRVVDPHAFADAFPYDEVERAAVDDHPSGARRFGDVHALAVACVHRAAHHCDTDNLLFLYDIHLLARAFDERDWQNFGDYARAKGLRTVSRRGLALAAEALGGAVPPNVEHMLAGGDDEPTALYVWRRLRRIDILRSDLHALHSWPDKLQLIWGHMFPGAEYMAASGEHSSYLSRIARGAAKWLKPL